MRDENNRNTLADLTYLEFEAKRRVEDTDMIPQDDLRDVNTYTEQSLSAKTRTTSPTIRMKPRLRMRNQKNV